MRVRRSKYSAPILVGIALSMAFHFGVIVPALVAVMTARTDAAPQLESDFDTDKPAPPPKEQPELELGKPESEHSTLVWLGYDEYEKHMAELAAVEQASFDEKPFGGTPALPAPPAQDIPQNPTAQQPPGTPSAVAEAKPHNNPLDNPLAQPSETELEIAHETPRVQPTVAAEIDAPDAQPTPLPADTVVTPNDPASVTSAPNATAPGELLDAMSHMLRNMLSTAQQLAEDMAQSRAAGKQDEHASPTEALASASSSKPASAAPNAESAAKTEERKPAPRVTASAPAPNPERPGEQHRAEQSDQESDPSSVHEVTMDDLKVGKPLATKGLELKPRKPTFTNLVRMTSMPGNPLCEIRFQHNGKPALARLLSSSGDHRVDDAVLASLYRWRAEGPELEPLGEGETINIRIRIILH